MANVEAICIPCMQEERADGSKTSPRIGTLPCQLEGADDG